LFFGAHKKSLFPKSWLNENPLAFLSGLPSGFRSATINFGISFLLGLESVQKLGLGTLSEFLSEEREKCKSIPILGAYKFLSFLSLDYADIEVFDRVSF
jgi:hypothetical protein